MAIVSVNTASAFDQLSFNFSELFNGTVTAATANLFRVSYSDGTADEFRGSFAYSGGVPVSGTVTAYAFKSGSTNVVTVDSVSVPVSSIANAAQTFSTSDDLAVIRTALAGADRMTGNSQSDRLLGFAGNDLIQGNGGNDRLFGGDGVDRVLGGAGNDVVNGDLGNDVLAGGAGNDNAIGGGGADFLRGDAGTDVLNGGAGNDRLVGGPGQDRLIGGANADVFDFDRTADSTVALRDRIVDFVRGTDRIDLSTIDADTDGTAGNQAFAFIGGRAFSGVDGQLRFANGAVFGDTNGDRTADFAIAVEGVAALGAADFIL